jgi:hypothetical protein
MPRGKSSKQYLNIVEVGYSLGLGSQVKEQEIRKMMRASHEEVMNYKYDWFVTKADIEPLYAKKCFSFRNFCRMFNVEPTLLQRYYSRPGIYQVELQYLYLILKSLPDIKEIVPDLGAIYRKIKSDYGSLYGFEKVYYSKGYHRQYFYKLFHGEINFMNQKNYARYTNLLKILNLPLKLSGDHLEDFDYASFARSEKMYSTRSVNKNTKTERSNTEKNTRATTTKVDVS